MATVTMVAEEMNWVDPDGGSSPVTIEMPDSSSLNDGALCTIVIGNQTSATTVDMTVNSSSPTDKLMSPADRSATLAGSFSSLTVTRLVMVYRLNTVDFANNTWWLLTPDSSGNW